MGYEIGGKVLSVSPALEALLLKMDENLDAVNNCAVNAWVNVVTLRETEECAHY
jgi:hypothetical protein